MRLELSIYGCCVKRIGGFCTVNPGATHTIAAFLEVGVGVGSRFCGYLLVCFGCGGLCARGGVGGVMQLDNRVALCDVRPKRKWSSL